MLTLNSDDLAKKFLVSTCKAPSGLLAEIPSKFHPKGKRLLLN